MDKEELRIGKDNICPVTKLPCDDECCPPSAICNISDSGSISPIQPEFKETKPESYGRKKK